MAAGNFQLYDSGLLRITDGTTDWNADSFYAQLHTSSYVPASTDAQVSDLDNECADADYDAQNLAGMSITNTAGVIKFDATDVEFGDPVTITAKYIVIIEGTVAGAASTDYLVGYMDLNTGGSAASTNGEFTIQWNANGIWSITQTS